MKTEVRHTWGWLLTLGILFIILGCLGLGMTIWLTLVSIFFIGVLFIVAGFAQLIDALQCRHWKIVAWHVAAALLYVMGGSLILYDPVLASTVITALIAWIFVFLGIARLVMALSLRESAIWGSTAFAGMVSFILGVLILFQWPASGLWVIGLFISIELLVNGWGYIFLAYGMRRTL